MLYISLCEISVPLYTGKSFNSLKNYGTVRLTCTDRETHTLSLTHTYSLTLILSHTQTVSLLHTHTPYLDPFLLFFSISVNKKNSCKQQKKTHTSTLTNTYKYSTLTHTHTHLPCLQFERSLLAYDGKSMSKVLLDILLNLKQ